MKKLFVVSTLGFLICLLLSSCYDNPSATNNINDEFIRPLAIGNYWIYDIDTSSHLYPLFYFDTMRVVSYENLNGYNAYGINCNSSFILYFNNMNGGHYFFQKILHDSTFEYIPQLHMKYPIRINETIEDVRKCISLNATFDKYSDCIDIVPVDTGGSSGMTNYHEYWKPGIGFLGAQFDFSGKHYVNRLKDYHVE